MTGEERLDIQCKIKIRKKEYEAIEIVDISSIKTNNFT